MLGRGGLLGSAVVRRLEAHGGVWVPTRPIGWAESISYKSSVEEAVIEFARTVNTGSEQWTIYWCAGVGTFGLRDNDLNSEIEQVDFLVQRLGAHLGANTSRGTFFYSSSAGGIYGGSLDGLISENSQISVNNEYGVTKHRIEQLLSSWSRSSGCRVAIGRISNLYGPGQDMSKKQGIISVACRSLVQQKTLEIFVPLDTTRNYIHARDASFTIVNFTSLVSRLPSEACEYKIICSPFNLSIAGLLLEIRRVHGKRVPVSLAQRSTSGLYVRNLSMVSLRFKECEPAQFTLPAVGVAEVRRKLLLDAMAGSLS